MSTNECVPIGNFETACAPLTTGLFLNVTAISRFYGLPSNPSLSQWEAARLSTLKSFRSLLGCNDDYTVRYSATAMCQADIERSKGCNQGRTLPQLCTGTCQAYTNDVSHMLQDAVACPNSNDPNIQHGRIQAGQCTVSQQTTCSIGVIADTTSCGYGGNLTIANAFCKYYSNAPPCCSNLAKISSDSFRVLVLDGTRAAQDPPTPPQTSNLPAVIGGSVAAVLICASIAIGLLIYKLRSRTSNTDATYFAPSDHKPASRRPSKSLHVNASLGRTHSTKRTSPTTPTTSVGRLLSTVSRQPTLEKSMKRPLTTPAAYSRSSSTFLEDAPVASGASIMTVVNEIRTAVAEYVPDNPDEIHVKPGHRIKIEAIFNDGWGKGENLSNKETGHFPMTSVTSSV
ncbi:hypothetical protein HDU79_008108 [Rhizoclosmatium sp. JEL0117]|nr:hypothetical protein HDU79_008108 [Rhizoclosmatium sp. JEL0117]